MMKDLFCSVIIGLAISGIIFSVINSPRILPSDPYAKYKGYQILIPENKKKEMKGNIERKYDDIYWLALNIYHEARGEKTLHGKMAVAFVTMNRVTDRRWPNTVKGVVTQAWQFSWTMDAIPDEPMDLDQWEDCWSIAKLSLDLYNSMAKDIPLEDADWLIKGANHYHAKTMKKYPRWASRMEKIVTLGNHIFYKI